MEKVITDADRKFYPRFSNEANDCTVRALAIAGRMEYNKAHAIMRRAGRKTGHGASVLCGLMDAHELGLLNFTRIDIPTHERVYNAAYAVGYVGVTGEPIRIKVHRMVGWNISQFVKQHQTGRYILRIKKHVFAVVDGVIHDLYELHGGKLVEAVWKVEPKVQS